MSILWTDDTDNIGGITKTLLSYQRLLQHWQRCDRVWNVHQRCIFCTVSSIARWRKVVKSRICVVAYSTKWAFFTAQNRHYWCTFCTESNVSSWKNSVRSGTRIGPYSVKFACLTGRNAHHSCTFCTVSSTARWTNAAKRRCRVVASNSKCAPLVYIFYCKKSIWRYYLQYKLCASGAHHALLAMFLVWRLLWISGLMLVVTVQNSHSLQTKMCTNSAHSAM